MHLELQCVAGPRSSSQHIHTEELHGHEILRADTSLRSSKLQIKLREKIAIYMQYCNMAPE